MVTTNIRREIDKIFSYEFASKNVYIIFSLGYGLTKTNITIETLLNLTKYNESLNQKSTIFFVFFYRIINFYIRS